MEVFFPYEQVRDTQERLLKKVNQAVHQGTNLIAHAPTGLGKTAAALAPALSYALKHDKMVFFLTSRHTQHMVAIDTLKEIRDRHNPAFSAVDIVGKKWLCLQPGVSRLTSGEFAEYCRKMREDQLCDYYENLKERTGGGKMGEKLTARTKRTLARLKKASPQVTEDIIDSAKLESVCPYEVSMILAKDSHVIVTDYFYIFNPGIRDSFLARAGLDGLEDCIVIVDEAHNLPDRVKNLASQRMSNLVVHRAAKEAESHGKHDLAEVLEKMDYIFKGYDARCEEEMYVPAQDFIDKVSKLGDYEELTDEMLEAGGEIREEQRRSYIAAVGEFLEAWKGQDNGFARIFSKAEGSKGKILILSYRCLDPSLVTRDVMEQAHSVIMMSGTLTPTHMYKELLGAEKCDEVNYPNPFPESNRLAMIVPRTSTKYSTRSEEQYEEMGRILADSVNAIPGNSIVFFPSYYLKDKVQQHLEPLCEKTIFTEERGMTKREKHEFLKKFKSNHLTGAVMTAVTSGSFGEGIDLPGDLLKGVIIVGLPLQKPDLEAKALIDYYDSKFGKGWDYGYIYPAFNKALQSAGRCIRSSTDKGVVVFLDERYAWSRYRKCFPPDWNLKVTMLYEKEIKDFFSR